MYIQNKSMYKRFQTIHFVAGFLEYHAAVAVAVVAAAAVAEIRQPGEVAGSLPAVGEAVWLEWQQQPEHAAWGYAPSSRDGTHDLCGQHGRGSVDSGRVFPEHAWWTGGESARTGGWDPGTSSCTADT